MYYDTLHKFILLFAIMIFMGENFRSIPTLDILIKDKILTSIGNDDGMVSLHALMEKYLKGI